MLNGNSELMKKSVLEERAEQDISEACRRAWMRRAAAYA